MIVDGIINRKKRVATRLGVFGEVSTRSRPSSLTASSTPGSACSPIRHSKGENDTAPGPEAVAFAHIMHGIHW